MRGMIMTFPSIGGDLAKIRQDSLDLDEVILRFQM